MGEHKPETKRQYSKRLKKILGYSPRNTDLYRMAFRHLSASQPLQPRQIQKDSNERLEYLGDAVLDLVVAELVFQKFPFRGEGHLTEVRSKIVSRRQLGILAEKMGLIEMIETDGNLLNNRHIQQSVGGNALEALIGAVYLDRGYKFSRKFIIKKVIKPYIDLDDIENLDKNFKSIINQWAQKYKKNLEFSILSDKENSRRFTIACLINGEEMGRASHFSKKNAEKLAAARACRKLGLLGDTPTVEGQP